MTTQEFSDSFDTLLNSYASQAAFGEQAARSEIVLDEYEKSVFLTQAQDIVVKSYFDARANSVGEGFDDSARRQVDFSSLIKVAELKKSNVGYSFDDRGIVYQLPRKKDSEGKEMDFTTDVLFILNEKMIKRTSTGFNGPEEYGMGSHNFSFTNKTTEDVGIQWQAVFDWTYGSANVYVLIMPKSMRNPTIVSIFTRADADTSDVVDELMEDGEFSRYLVLDGYNSPGKFSDYSSEDFNVLDTYVIPSNNRKDTSYVVVPINYKEYDREMSKAYAQPLKKQAWRLFQNQNTGFDVNTELIPKFDIKEGAGTSLYYKIRYVKRPIPIVLTKFPEGLEIDGESDVTKCELNPILHPDILQKAVELAVTTRGGVAPRQREEQRQRQ